MNAPSPKSVGPTALHRLGFFVFGGQFLTQNRAEYRAKNGAKCYINPAVRDPFVPRDFLPRSAKPKGSDQVQQWTA